MQDWAKLLMQLLQWSWVAMLLLIQLQKLKPFEMALAFKNAVIAGRQSFLAEEWINLFMEMLFSKERNYLSCRFFKKFFFLMIFSYKVFSC